MQGLVYRVATQSDSDPFEFIMSDETIDRYGDVISADGWDVKEFKANPVALFNHNTDAIIGRWEKVRIDGKRLVGRLVLADPGTDPVVDKVRKWWDQKLIRMVSVGFLPIKSEPLNKDDDGDDWFAPVRYLKQKLLECSLVTIPANPNAGPIGRSFALPADAQRQLFGQSASRELRPAPAPSRVPASTTIAQRGTTKMKTPLTKQIENTQTEINRLRDRLTEITGLEERNDEQDSLFDTLPGLIEASMKELGRLQNVERVLGFQATENNEPGTQLATIPSGGSAAERKLAERPFAIAKKKIDPADYMVRAITCGVRAFGQQVSLDRARQDLYGSDEATEIVLRAAVNPANTGVAGYAQELVQTATGAFLDRLIANSIYAPLSSAGARYDLGKNGSLKIPVRTSTPRAFGAWVGEGAPKPVKRIGLTSATLTPHKLAVITTFTEEMALYSTPAIEGLLRKAMADDTQESLDGYLIDNVTFSATRPSGLLFGVTPIAAASTGTTIEKIVSDISALVAPMEAAGIGGKIVLLMNPAQARKLGMAQTTTGDFAFGSAAEAASKMGVESIISSTVIPAGKVIAVDADWFATATGDAPRFAVSNEATLHEEDTSPLPLVTGAQGSGVVASPMRSLFQTDSIAIRLSLYVTWTVTRAEAVQVITAVGW